MSTDIISETFLNPSPGDSLAIKRLLSSGEGQGWGAYHSLGWQMSELLSGLQLQAIAGRAKKRDNDRAKDKEVYTSQSSKITAPY